MLKELYPNNPSYEAQFADIVNNSIVGLDSSEAVGKHVYITDRGITYTVLSDYTLSPYTASQVSIVDPVSGNNVEIGSDNALKTKIIIEDNAIGSTNPVPISGNAGEPIATQIRPNDPTAYAIGDVVGNATTNMTFANVHPIAGSHIIITNLLLEIDVTTIPSGMSSFRLHLYDSNPTNIPDNSPFNVPVADRAKYLGFIEIDSIVELGDTLYSSMKNINYKTKLATGSTSLYAMLETRSAFTPSAQCTKSIRLGIVGV